MPVPPENIDALDFRQYCSVWWVPTHYRVAHHFSEEVPARVKEFNVEMRRFFDSNSCGLVNYVDVYNMTQSLAVHYPEDANSMSYDKMHWSMEVNLVKSQIMLNALASANKDVANISKAEPPILKGKHKEPRQRARNRRRKL